MAQSDHFVMLTDFGGQEFEQDTEGMACLCCMMSGAWAGKTFMVTPTAGVLAELWLGVHFQHGFLAHVFGSWAGMISRWGSAGRLLTQHIQAISPCGLASNLSAWQLDSERECSGRENSFHGLASEVMHITSATLMEGVKGFESFFPSKSPKSVCYFLLSAWSSDADGGVKLFSSLHTVILTPMVPAKPSHLFASIYLLFSLLMPILHSP